METTSIIEAAERFNPTMGSKAEKARQVRAIREALDVFIQAAIDLTDALAFDCDAEDDDPDHEHDGSEQEQGDICGHYRMDQTVAPSPAIWAQPVYPDTII